MAQESCIRVSRVFWIDVRRITPNPSQPRKHFEEERLQGLAQSIAKNGVLQPLCVRQTGEKVELISGERRLKAAVLAGLQRVPCIVLEANDRESAVFALLENIQRADLHYFEEAEAIQNLIEVHHLTQEEAAFCLGKTQPTVCNKLRLLRIPAELRKTIVENDISERKARQLLVYNDTHEMKQCLLSMLHKDQIAGKTAKQTKETVKNKVVFKDLKIFLNTFNKAVDVMRNAGIDAGTQQRETDDYIIYTVTIPKSPHPKDIP